MENQEINEAEIIEGAKKMTENGLGSAFVYKWVRERVPDAEMRKRILDQVNNVNAKSKDKKDKTQVAKERKIREAKYLYEDFTDSIRKINRAAYILIGLGVLWIVLNITMISFIPSHGVVSVLSGIAILVLKGVFDFKEQQILSIASVGFLVLTILEYLTLGLPSRLLPGLGETNTHKLVNIITLVNDFSPLLYYAVKIGLSFFLFKALYLGTQVSKLSTDLKRHLGLIS